MWQLPENEQELWRRRFDRQQATCQQCGHLRSECSDPTRKWFPQLTICYATMEKAAAARRWEEVNKDQPFHMGDFATYGEKASLLFPYHFKDGAHLWVDSVDHGRWIGKPLVDPDTSETGDAGTNAADSAAETR